MERINMKNQEKIDQKLDDVQRKARVRTIDYNDIQSIVMSLEARLSTLMPKKHWAGFKARIDVNHGKVAGSYNGIPESTIFTLLRGVSEWYITDIVRGSTFQRVSPYADIVFTEQHKTAILEFLTRNL